VSIDDDATEVAMYCPECEEMVPENWDRVDERWRCERCGSALYSSKDSYIQAVHATARFNKEYGWGPWYDGRHEQGGEQR